MKYRGNIEECGVVFYDVVIRSGRFPVQTPVGAQPGIGTQSYYEAPGDLPVEIVQTQ